MHRMARRHGGRVLRTRTRQLLSLSVGLGLVGSGSAAAHGTAPPTTSDRAPAPALNVQAVQGGLDIPWDIAFTDAQHYLVNERVGRIWFANTNPAIPRRRVSADFSDVVTLASGGLMGMAADPGFARNRTFYTCQTHRTPKDVRVVRWRLSADGTRAVRSGVPVLSGIPFGNPHYGLPTTLPPGWQPLGRNRRRGESHWAAGPLESCR